MIILAYYLIIVKEDFTLDFTDYLRQIYNEWILNNYRDSIAEFLSLHLLIRRVAVNIVSQTQIYWYKDDRIMIYKNIIFNLQNLRDWIRYNHETTRNVFINNLYFNLDDVPEYDLKIIRDNWDNEKLESLFLDNPRNEIYFADDR